MGVFYDVLVAWYASAKLLAAEGLAAALGITCNENYSKTNYLFFDSPGTDYFFHKHSEADLFSLFRHRLLVFHSKIKWLNPKEESQNPALLISHLQCMPLCKHHLHYTSIQKTSLTSYLPILNFLMSQAKERTENVPIYLC